MAQQVLKESICCSRAMLSVSKSRMSTNWPDLILSTNLLGKGSEAGDKLNPGDDDPNIIAADDDPNAVELEGNVTPWKATWGGCCGTAPNAGKGRVWDHDVVAPPVTLDGLGISGTETREDCGGRRPREASEVPVPVHNQGQQAM